MNNLAYNKLTQEHDKNMMIQIMRVNLTLSVLLTMFFLVMFAAGKDIYVSLAGTNHYPFTNWPDATTNIEWAVNTGVNGDTVWISNGTYVLTNQINVISNITVCGFTNNGTVIIDGNNAARCFNVGNGTLANLFITRGSAADCGGGVYMQTGAARDCVFSNNVCTSNGGGMYVTNGAIQVQRCVFIGNSAYSGGGLFLDSISAVSTALIAACVFHTNSTAAYGGGLHCFSSRNTTVSGCVFTCNTASNEGGGARFNNYNILVTHCTFASNVVVGGAANGGGVALAGGTIIFTNSSVNNNISDYTGGGIYNFSGQVRNCVIARNTAKVSSGADGGGGVKFGANGNGLVQDCIIEENTSFRNAGGVYLTASATIRNCLIRNNVASWLAGGMRINGNNIVVGSCTIVSNCAGSSGGGMYNDIPASQTARMDNCIIYFNSDSGGGYSNFFVSSINSSYSNCAVAPELTVGITNNNILADPQFVNWTAGNYHLTAGSPCINAGVNRDWMAGASDLDGYRRVDKFSGVADIGCYEYVPQGTMFSIP